MRLAKLIWVPSPCKTYLRSVPALVNSVCHNINFYFFFQVEITLSKLLFSFWYRQGKCRKADGSQDGFERTKMVVIAIWAATGKQEKKGTGMKLLIYLARAVIHLHVYRKTNLIPSRRLLCSSYAVVIFPFFLPPFRLLSMLNSNSKSEIRFSFLYFIMEFRRCVRPRLLLEGQQPL